MKVTVLGALVGGLLGCISTAPLFAQDTDPYAPYRGTTITVSWPTLGHFQKAEQLAQEFEALSGITVAFEAQPYLSLRETQISEMSKPVGSFDLVSWVIMWKGEYVANGYLTPLAQFFVDAALVNPDYDVDDIVPAYLESGGMVGGDRGYLPGTTGALYGVPFGAETSMMAYRTDIFAELNLDPPSTYDELRVAMKVLSDNGYNALTSRGQKGGNVTFAWLLHLTPLGGRVFDEDWNPQVNAPEAIAAAELLREIRRTGPDDMARFGFGDSTLSFLQGDAAIYLDNTKIAAVVDDPGVSQVSGKVGYALHPTDVNCSSETGGFAIGIPQNSQNKEAAFLFLQYLTSREGDQRMVDLGGDPVRMSTLFNNKETHPQNEVIFEQLPCANPDWRPLVPEWNEIQADVLGPALFEAMHTDKPIAPLMDAANEKLRVIMEREGYYTWR